MGHWTHTGIEPRVYDDELLTVVWGAHYALCAWLGSKNQSPHDLAIHRTSLFLIMATTRQANSQLLATRYVCL